MRVFPLNHLGTLAIFLACNAWATVRYVNVNNTNAASPYITWATASTDIQDAINASATGDIVLVTNGIYASGGMPIAGGVTNRVALINAITVQSVNGPFVTIIQGAGAAVGPSSVRCAWLTNYATLTGFTLEFGATSTSDIDGGGVWCASTNAFVNNCVIVSNIAYNVGAGVYQGTLNNCLISNNTNSSMDPAVWNATLKSCTIANNGTVGTSGCTLTNCILYSNTFSQYQTPWVFAYCCTTPLPAGKGNFTNAPQLFADGVHLLSNSPCIGAGTNLVTGTDIFGNAWGNPPSMGCAEYNPAPVVTLPSINLTGYPFGFAFNAAGAGVPAPSFFWLKDGIPLQNDGHFSATQTTNLVVANVNITDAGSYEIVASNALGVVTSAVTTLAMHCVNAAGLHPIAPYSTWATAATNIQDAITASANNDIVLVTNGIYSTGAQTMDGASSNRVSLNKAICVQSVNGPSVTTIQGGGATNGTSAIRCAWLTNNAVLVGFTLKGGATQNSGNFLTAESGGGVWCASSNAFVQNCVIVSNAAYNYGCGVYQGTLNNCLIKSNTGGSAAYSANLNSCTIVSNSTFGLMNGTMTNCIDYYNDANSMFNHSSGVTVAAYCCTTPTNGLSGPGNVISAPNLQADGAHLASGSPCIQAGLKVVIGTDIFGRPWANPPSIGCAEYNGLPTVNQPQITLMGEPVGFNVGNVTYNGQTPLAFQWLENGVPLQNNGHFNSTQTTNLMATGVSLTDAGNYQLVVSNSFGAVTSAAVSLVVHAVDAMGANPQSPFLSWATAATNIQDAIEAASAGDIVLVTNGIYDAGGEALTGSLSNRVALDRGLMVVSVNGWASTIIEGAWDPVSTNGPDAVRCAWLTNGAILSGFTLQDGATQNTGNITTLQCGGGVWCASTNALVSNCLLSNNFAAYGGGGFALGTLNNSLVVSSVSLYGGGAYDATLNNCTVQFNYTYVASSMTGGGTYGGTTRNSIVIGNLDGYPEHIGIDNYGTAGASQPQYSYCCTYNEFYQAPSGPGNTSADPQLLDLYHLSINSPCRGAGSALYASGYDLDGEAWSNAPSIGCDEVVASNRVGSLSVTVLYSETNVLVSSQPLQHPDSFFGMITGMATYLSWNFGDGPTISNADWGSIHYWTNMGDYTVVFTAYNLDNPSGVSTSQVIHVLPVNSPQLQPPTLLSNIVQFQFTTQAGANYTVQYATNLASPATWVTLESIYNSPGGVAQIQDSAPTNAARFYRVEAQ